MRVVTGKSATLVVFLLSLAIGGCEEVVDPVLEIERPFTLYGYLNPGSDRQALRVFPIEGILEPTDRTPLAADIHIMDPSGVRYAMVDTVIQYRDGSIGHVFQADYQPDFDAVYTISARDPEGRETTVAVRTPSQASMTLEAASGVLGNVRMPVTFESAEQVLSPRVLYTFETRAPFTWTIPVTYERDVVRVGDAWSVNLDISRDIGVLFTVSGLRPGIDPMTLTELRVEAFIATTEWTPPGGVFDRVLLVQPGVFSNVDNGFGFVGSGYFESAATLPEAEILRLAGFDNE